MWSMICSWIHSFFYRPYNRFNNQYGEIPLTSLKEGDWLMYNIYGIYMLVYVVENKGGVFKYGSHLFMNDVICDDSSYHSEHMSAIYIGSTKRNILSKFDKLTPLYVQIRKPKAFLNVVFNKEINDIFLRYENVLNH